jgi:hypothetical protein
MAELRAFVGHSFLKVDEEVVRAFLEHFNTLEKAGIGFTWDHAEEAQALPLSTKVPEKIEGKTVFIGNLYKKRVRDRRFEVEVDLGQCPRETSRFAVEDVRLDHSGNWGWPWVAK